MKNSQTCTEKYMRKKKILNWILFLDFFCPSKNIVFNVFFFFNLVPFPCISKWLKRTWNLSNKKKKRTAMVSWLTWSIHPATLIFHQKSQLLYVSPTEPWLSSIAFQVHYIHLWLYTYFKKFVKFFFEKKYKVLIWGDVRHPWNLSRCFHSSHQDL